jgi:crotonobetainyl-CoA:carnitine CoA-transferase CaiB-like acyl-CoA transferase
VPQMAPRAGEHTDDVLRKVCSYDDARLTALRAAGAFGQQPSTDAVHSAG